jgi:hypothetical protein
LAKDNKGEEKGGQRIMLKLFSMSEKERTAAKAPAKVDRNVFLLPPPSTSSWPTAAVATAGEREKREEQREVKLGKRGLSREMLQP